MQKHMSKVAKSQAVVPLGPRFGARLREIRLARGLTQPQIAARVGTSASNISDLERGVKVPTLTTVARLADVLECNVSELVEVLDRWPRRSRMSRNR